TPNGLTIFPFAASPSPLSSFSLVDDGTSANTKAISNITTFQTYTVTETPIPAGWTLTGISCLVTTPNGGSYSTSSNAVQIAINEGENWTCTFTNNGMAHLTLVKHLTNDNGGTAAATD